MTANRTQGSTNPFYTSPAWRTLRDSFRQAWLRQGKPCGYCGKAIARNESVAVDHIVPVRQRPDLSLNPANLRCVHSACNTAARHSVQKVGVNVQGFPPGWD
jgi:5-methylcytosine-specific restriction endonuclease McrA